MEQGTARAGVVRQVLLAGLTGRATGLAGLFTEDVVGWTPNLTVSCLAEIESSFGARDEVLTNVDLDVRSMDAIGDKVIAEWQVAADHTGALAVDDDRVVEATGRRVLLAGVMVAEFRGDRIAVFRTYFDELALLEQILEGN
ncbi:MAG: nuclear transport factor 2 family protein [Acidimicrobiales bacterium]